MHKIILGGPDRQEAEGVEEGQKAEPEEDEQKVLEFLVFPVPLLRFTGGCIHPVVATATHLFAGFSLRSREQTLALSLKSSEELRRIS